MVKVLLLVTWLLAGTGAKFNKSFPLMVRKLNGLRLDTLAVTLARGTPVLTRSAL